MKRPLLNPICRYRRNENGDPCRTLRAQSIFTIHEL